MGKEIVTQLAPIFRARSVAIIGASNNPTKWGYSLVERPPRSGFPGKLYPINPGEQIVLGVPAYPSTLAFPQLRRVRSCRACPGALCRSAPMTRPAVFEARPGK